jgi:hypothetical protein
MKGLGEGAKPDERQLWEAVLSGEWARNAGKRLGIHPKRVQALCEKWSVRRIYSYGVTCDLGWAEPTEIHDAPGPERP